MKKITGLLLMSVLLIVISAGCGKDDDTPEPAVNPVLGMRHGGGIIFYIDGTGQHGLIADSVDISPTDPWWNGSFVTTGATSNTDGAANTTAIIRAQGNGTYAASLCRNYRGGGHSDWFLPAKDQLNLLYQQKTLVGGFSNQIYWTSTEYSTGEAWVQDLETGQQHLDNTSDGANVHTRAIRAF